jgi:TrmH family RNA methyltransferase
MTSHRKQPRCRTWQAAVADLERALTARGRTRLGAFRIEGTRLHERALRAGRTVQCAVAGAGFRSSSDPRARMLLADLESSGCELHEAPDSVVQRLTEGRSHGDVVGLVPLPDEPSLEDLLRQDRAPLLLVGVDLDEPGNVGALVRTALASGATAFIAAGNSDPFHPKAVRTSMGGVFKLPILRFDAVTWWQQLTAGRVATVAAVSTGGTPLPEARFEPGGLAVILGSEAFGLPDILLERCDQRVTIPMASKVDSFSVNAAAAVLLYEIRTRRA